MRSGSVAPHESVTLCAMPGKMVMAHRYGFPLVGTLYRSNQP